MLLPLELVDSFIGKRVYVVTKQDKELEATLTGVDAYVNLVLKDVWEFDVTAEGTMKKGGHFQQLLLNGNTVAFISMQEKPTSS